MIIPKVVKKRFSHVNRILFIGSTCEKVMAGTVRAHNTIYSQDIQKNNRFLDLEVV